MTIKELRDQLDTLGDEERAMWLRRLLPKMSGITMNELDNFQQSWCLKKGPFEVFKAEQNKIIRRCIEMEIHPAYAEPLKSTLGIIAIKLEDEL